MENLISSDPLYAPSPDLSPRVRSAFSDVRRRVLPSIVTQQYGKAKQAFDRKDWVTAAAGFTQVLQVLADPDVAQAASQPPLSDLRTLATGFQELSTKAIPPPPPPAPEPPPVPAAPAPPRIYTTSDAAVTLPTAIRQDLPNFSGRVAEPLIGALEVIIDERGLVESATIRQSVNGAYDRMALDAARSWRYRPATVDGAPVKFRKLIQIALKPTTNQ
jgi:protein TonB